ncbi:putative transcription regulator containing HTH domain [Opitutaceae bacterium TAV1]|nr:XRE family transcriptional regulator [Opitutaceae bacterium TAV5]EIQ00954.1 putative transcription regulator containing HTH domain [Opitutaceae bacterium TAV1]
MKKTRNKLSFEKLPTTYEGLVKLHMPRPIRDKVAYDNTVEVLDMLVLPYCAGELNADQDDYAQLLTDLVEAYDKENAPDEPEASGLDALKYLMEEHDMTGSDLARILGVDRSVASRILKGERNLTTAHIKALSAHFGASPATFLD